MLKTGMHAGQLFTLLIIAMALGMDAFSLGHRDRAEGYSALDDILKFGVVIALFHIIMPLDGHVYRAVCKRLLGGVATTQQACCWCFSAGI